MSTYIVHSEQYIPAAPPNPNDGAEDGVDAGAAPVEAPPKRDGFAASPGFAAFPPKPKLGVDDAPAVAPPPNRPPGLLAAGVLDAPPPKRPAPPEPAPPPPNNPVLGALDPVFAVPKRDGDEVPVVLLAPPNSPPAGFGVLEPALLPAGCPNVKADMVAVGKIGCRRCKSGVRLVVVGCCLLLVKPVEGAQLARKVYRGNGTTQVKMRKLE